MQVTGVSYERYLQDHLLKPARMTKTGYHGIESGKGPAGVPDMP